MNKKTKPPPIMKTHTPHTLIGRSLTLAAVVALWLLPAQMQAQQEATNLAKDVAAEKKDTLTEKKADGAENIVTADINIMTRGELRKGGLSGEDNGEDFAAFVLERMRLGLTYERGPLSLRFAAQQGNTWGSKQDNELSVYEAWVKFCSRGGLFVTLGRQELSYDDQRIFGADDWSMTAKTHDALRFGYEGRVHKAHAILSFNQNPENMDNGTHFSGGLQPHKALQALWYHYDLPRTGLGVSLLFMNVGMQASERSHQDRTFQQQLFGGHACYESQPFAAHASLYFQRGKQEDGLKLESWMMSLKAMARPSAHWEAYAGYDYLSGDDNYSVPATGVFGLILHKKVKGFTSIYGSHHRFYGAMDFFYVSTYFSGFSPGLQNLYVGTKWKPTQRLRFDLAYHYLATATGMKHARRSLGHEVEFSATWEPMRDVSLSAGYTFMDGTKTMELLKRTDKHRQLHWGWIMLSVSPRLFQIKW